MQIKGILKTGLLLSSVSCLTAPLHADVIGVHGKAGVWHMNYSGEFKDTGDLNSTLVDVEDDLGFDTETLGFAEISFEHPIPVVPNVKLGYLNIDTSETNNLSRTITFNGETFTANTDISSGFKAKMYDFTMYYELLDNWIQADVGLTVRYMDVDISAKTLDNAVSTEESFEFPLPLLYGNAQFDLPLTNVYANITANGIAIDDAYALDAQAAIGWMPLEFIGGEVGYRHFTIDADDLDDYEFDITLSGPYIALKADF